MKAKQDFSKVITDPAILDKVITTGLTLYAQAHDILHVAAVSAIHMVAVNGQTGPLNRLYEGLKPNDRQALQLYIKRAHILVALDGKSPDGLSSDDIKKAADDGAVISRKEKKFSVRRNFHTDQAKKLAELCVTRFFAPDGEIDLKVFDRNNIAEVRLMGDDDFLNKLIKAGKEIEEGDTESRTVAISEPTKKLILDAAMKATYLKNQLSLAKTSSTGTAH